MARGFNFAWRAMAPKFAGWRVIELKLDPVSRVTGIPGWYWILGIKCSDTTGVGLVYWNSELVWPRVYTYFKT